ncbi:DUF2283 domain-containing protein [Actinoplanes palleronii]
MVPLKVTYDEVADAAYIYFQAPGTRAATMYPCDPVDVNGMINLDFDATGRLIGLEVGPYVPQVRASNPRGRVRCNSFSITASPRRARQPHIRVA